jgi:hypothetical protein
MDDEYVHDRGGLVFFPQQAQREEYMSKSVGAVCTMTAPDSWPRSKVPSLVFFPTPTTQLMLLYVIQMLFS